MGQVGWRALTASLEVDPASTPGLGDNTGPFWCPHLYHVWDHLPSPCCGPLVQPRPGIGPYAVRWGPRHHTVWTSTAPPISASSHSTPRIGWGLGWGPRDLLKTLILFDCLLALTDGCPGLPGAAPGARCQGDRPPGLLSMGGEGRVPVACAGTEYGHTAPEASGSSQAKCGCIFLSPKYSVPR